MLKNQPNILLIVTDQQRGDCLGLDPHSPAVLQTPNLDHIARSGLHCTRAYAECPSCIPARDPHAHPLQTPHLDYLARSGLHCTRAYAECPSCIPARRSLMTGTAPAANGIVGFQGAEWHPAHTLAGSLAQAGYQTEMIGKMHLHPPTCVSLTQD